MTARSGVAIARHQKLGLLTVRSGTSPTWLPVTSMPSIEAASLRVRTTFMRDEKHPKLLPLCLSV